MDPGKIDPTSPWLIPGHVRILFKHAFWHIHFCSLPFPRKLHSFVEITTMHSYVKLLVLCLLAIFAAQASAKEEKEEGGQKPKPTGKTDAYGIPVTKKSGMNRACRTCSSPACLSTSSNRATTHRLTDSLTSLTHPPTR